jgi:hypothetical protein
LLRAATRLLLAIGAVVLERGAVRPILVPVVEAAAGERQGGRRENDRPQSLSPLSPADYRIGQNSIISGTPTTKTIIESGRPSRQ